MKQKNKKLKQPKKEIVKKFDMFGLNDEKEKSELKLQSNSMQSEGGGNRYTRTKPDTARTRH